MAPRRHSSLLPLQLPERKEPLLEVDLRAGHDVGHDGARRSEAERPVVVEVLHEVLKAVLEASIGLLAALRGGAGGVSLLDVGRERVVVRPQHVFQVSVPKLLIRVEVLKGRVCSVCTLFNDS